MSELTNVGRTIVQSLGPRVAISLRFSSLDEGSRVLELVAGAIFNEREDRVEMGPEAIVELRDFLNEVIPAG